MIKIVPDNIKPRRRNVPFINRYDISRMVTRIFFSNFMAFFSFCVLFQYFCTKVRNEMNWWAIIGVVFLVALATGFWAYRSSNREDGSFWGGFFVGGMGCLSLLLSLFFSLISVLILYFLFSWIFG